MSGLLKLEFKMPIVLLKDIGKRRVQRDIYAESRVLAAENAKGAKLMPRSRPVEDP